MIVERVCRCCLYIAGDRGTCVQVSLGYMYIPGDDCGMCVQVPLGCLYITGDCGTCVQVPLGYMYITGDDCGTCVQVSALRLAAGHVHAGAGHQGPVLQVGRVSRPPAAHLQPHPHPGYRPHPHRPGPHPRFHAGSQR